MGLLTGTVSVTRLEVTARPPEIDFEAAAFREIQAGSEIRESVGFVPFEPGAPYEVGAARHAFRVRIDRLRPDPTAVRERLKELVRSEIEVTGAPFVGPKKRRQLKSLAEEELIVRQAPSTRIVECCLDGDVVYVGSAARAYLGTVMLLLRRIGIETAFKTPWTDKGLPEVYSDLVETQDQAESVYGCRFLKALIGDRDFLVEPEAGRVRLATRDAQVTLAGGVLSDLHAYLKKEVELLSAKLLTGEVGFTLDAPSFRLTGLRLAPVNNEHWTLDLDERLEQIGDLFAKLERKFEKLGVS